MVTVASESPSSLETLGVEPPITMSPTMKRIDTSEGVTSGSPGDEPVAATLLFLMAAVAGLLLL